MIRIVLQIWTQVKKRFRILRFQVTLKNFKAINKIMTKKKKKETKLTKLNY